MTGSQGGGMSQADPTPNSKHPGMRSFFAYQSNRIGPRALMISGFSALLILMAVLAFDSIRALRDLEANSARVRQAYVTREGTLRKIRVSLYESGNLLREYTLKDSSPDTRRSYVAQLHDLRDHANAAMETCLTQSAPELQDPLRQLSSELASYWLAADQIMDEGVNKNNQIALHKAAVAQRSNILAMANEVSKVNELELHLANFEISKLFARSRDRLENFTALAIGIGLLLAILSIVYVSRLEKRAREKYLESLSYERELKELSKSLVDAQENERRSISRELHDEIAQTLGALLINVRDLIDSPEPSNSNGKGLQKIRLLAEDCVHKVRNMALLLRPSMLDDLGLIAALEWQAREVSKRNGLLVQILDRDFDDDLPEEYKTCIYRIVQEALNNCTAHAHASHVRVRLEEDNEYCILSIEDDGVGFDPARKSGLGLLGMHERVARLGGTLVLDAAPGRGTNICVKIPLIRSRQNEPLLS
jgi:signal transduction histidine kinase